MVVGVVSAVVVADVVAVVFEGLPGFHSIHTMGGCFDCSLFVADTSSSGVDNTFGCIVTGLSLGSVVGYLGCSLHLGFGIGGGRCCFVDFLCCNFGSGLPSGGHSNPASGWELGGLKKESLVVVLGV